jgi:hypothetical protein
MPASIVIDPQWLFSFLFLKLRLNLKTVDSVVKNFATSSTHAFRAECTRQIFMAEVEKIARKCEIETSVGLWANYGSVTRASLPDNWILLHIKLDPDNFGHSYVQIQTQKGSQLHFLYWHDTKSPGLLTYPVAAKPKWTKLLRRMLFCFNFLQKLPEHIRIKDETNSSSQKESFYRCRFASNPGAFIIQIWTKKDTIMNCDLKIPQRHRYHLQLDFGVNQNGIGKLYLEDTAQSGPNFVNLSTWKECVEIVCELLAT